MKKSKQGKKEAGQYKQELYAQVRKYFVKSEERQSNTGQLSFLKGLFVSNLAVASPVPVKRPENILDHLNSTIFDKSAPDLCLMFDKKENLESFLRSVYFEKKPKFIHFLEDDEGECLPFLLIQQAQAKMEQALCNYVSFENKEESTQKKNKAFLNLLYSTALYEIFLREYEQRLIQEPAYARPEFQSVEVEQVLQSGAFGEAEGDVRAVIERGVQASALLFYTSCVMYHARHMVNLFAVLRILLFVEYVSLNHIRERSKKNTSIFFREARIYKEQVKIWKEKDLFLPLHNNKNLYVLQNVLIHICLEGSLYPHLTEGKKFEFEQQVNDFTKDFRQYMDAVKVCQGVPVNERPAAGEEHLWKTAEQMAGPMISAMEEILMVRENAKEQKAKNAEK